MRPLIPVSVLFVLATTATAQGPVFQSPGTSPYSTLGQTTRFSREFNPAFGFVVDGFFDYRDVGSAADGYDFSLRLFELNAAAFVDPDAWAYVVLTSEELESPGVEEAAVEYVGLDGNATFKAGRFFVDFGKQMQQHVEELRTLERPLPLREYLGPELGGTGVQYDDWFAAGDETPVRFSLGVFGQLLPGGEEEDGGPFTQETSVMDNKALDALSFTARLTGMTDVGDTGLFQLGLSSRILPRYELDLEFDDGMGTQFSDTREDLDEIVWGADATFQRTDDTGTRTLLLGAEVLLADGDLSAVADAGTQTFSVNDDTAFGWYAYGDYAWSPFDSAGVQVARADLRLAPDEQLTETEVYYTRHFTEYRRLRLGAIHGDVETGADTWRLYVQLTAFFGSHSHGINW